jgi:hypothetical protein
VRVETVELGERRADDHRAHDVATRRVPVAREGVERFALSGIETYVQAFSSRAHIVGP